MYLALVKPCREHCSFWYKSWPIISMPYFILIRAVELEKLDELMTNKRLHVLFCGIFFPSYLLLTILGFHWFFEATTSKCVSGS